MSQDGNNNLFGNFQPSPFDPANLYHPDITSMQFASSVPHRPSSTSSNNSQNHIPMSFSPFPNQDVIPPHPSFSLGYPGSPYDRPDSIGSGTPKQLLTKAERRAEHNATERARRESLNVKFQQLAFTLPNLQNDSRPSKGTIIDRTLDFVKGAIIKEERMQYRINELEKFSRYLLSELDKKNNTKAEEAASSSSPLTTTEVEIISSPVARSVASEDSMVEEVKLEFNNGHYQPTSPPATPTTKTTKQQLKRETGITNRRLPVSRTSVPMIPNNIDTTNWPTTSNSPSTMNNIQLEQHRMHIFEQQQQALIFQQQQQQILTKKQNLIPMTNNVFQHSFNPTTVPTTNMRFAQHINFPEQEQFMTTDSEFLFQGDSNLMELH